MMNAIQVKKSKTTFHIPKGLSRREFIKRLGGGIIIAVTVSDFGMIDEVLGKEMAEDLNAYLRVGYDGRVTCFTGKIEMGQGIITSLAQMIADELDVALDKVDMVMGDTDLCPYDRGTWGSLTTRVFGPALRAAAAEARSILIEMASEKMKIERQQLRTNEGIIYYANNSEQKITYEELTRGEKILKQAGEKPALKDPSEFRIMGKPLFRHDALPKVTGTALYSGDIRIPGMVYARILRPPAHGATLVSFDRSALNSQEGFELITDGDLVAVLHKDPEAAERGLKKLNAVFKSGESTLTENTIHEHLLKKAPEPEIVEQGGDLASGEKEAVKTIEREFRDSYFAHAPMETHTALAVMEGTRMIIRASTQSPFGLKSEVAQVLSMNPEDVHIREIFTGGGFGGKSNNRQGVEAAKLAKLSGKPVMLYWTRQEEFFYDTYRPAAVIRIKSGLNKEGLMTTWDYGVYFAGQRGAAHFYNIPNHVTKAYNSGWVAPEGVHPFNTGPWRAPGNNSNTFARESFINILAEESGLDPLEFRLKNLKNERMAGVLKAAASEFGYTPIQSPSGKGYGMACGYDAGTYVAHMAEVHVNKNTGEVKVVRVVCAQDMGLVINPQGAVIQMEGCIIMGLGYALSETIRFTGGNIHTRNFDSYKIPRFSWVPEIKTILMPSTDPNPQGGGEPAIICMGALLANAIYDATGIRMYQLPMTPDKILQALQNK